MKNSQLSHGPFLPFPVQLNDAFPLDILDTIFITDSLRGQGYAQKLLSQILEKSHQEDLGFSTPISTGKQA